MLVSFKNTGMIEKADIRLDGLTVIAGENNTGKSTVGKMMYSVIKTFNRYLIEALKLYADEFLGKNQADFYWSKRGKNAFVSCFNDVTQDLSPVYNTLAEPYRKLDRLKAKKLFS